MSMTLAAVKQSIEKSGLSCSQRDDLLVIGFEDMIFFRNRDGEPNTSVIVQLTDDGERITYVIPYAFQLQDSESRVQVLRTLFSRQFHNPLVRYEYDPDDAEIRMSVDLLLEDNEVSIETVPVFAVLLAREADNVHQELRSFFSNREVVAELEASIAPGISERTVDQLANVLREFNETDVQEAVLKAGFGELKSEDESGSEIQVCNSSPTERENDLSMDLKVPTGEAANQLDLTDPVILIRLTKTYKPSLTAKELYDATRGNWAINIVRARQARYAYALNRGKVIQVYRIDRWSETSELSGHGRPRICFTGEAAVERVHHIGSNLSHYFKRGEASPTKFLNCE